MANTSMDNDEEMKMSVEDQITQMQEQVRNMLSEKRGLDGIYRQLEFDEKRMTRIRDRTTNPEELKKLTEALRENAKQQEELKKRSADTEIEVIGTVREINTLLRTEGNK